MDKCGKIELTIKAECEDCRHLNELVETQYIISSSSPYPYADCYDSKYLLVIFTCTKCNHFNNYEEEIQ